LSEIRADTISDAAGTGPIALTKQSAAKAWVAHSSTPSINGSYNVASLTDNAAGNFDINLINAMANVNYSIPSSCESGARISSTQDVSASEFNIVYFNVAGVQEDRGGSAEVLGDLA